MPEGDTIHRAAERLRGPLLGKAVIRFEAPRARARGLVRRPGPGTVVESVEAVGKHLLIGFDSGVVLRTHMRMNGSWRVVRTGEPWPRPVHLMRALIEVEGTVAVCFSAPVVELEAARPPSAGGAVGRPRSVAHLGPDLSAPDVTAADVDTCVARMASFADEQIGVVLLDQRVACGVGNVFRSEVLWAERVDPFATVESLDVATRRRLVETAAAQLRIAVEQGRRGAHRGRLAAYGRTRRPCPRCGTAIRAVRQGEQARSVYWCPRCQQQGKPDGSSSSAPASAD